MPTALPTSLELLILLLSVKLSTHVLYMTCDQHVILDHVELCVYVVSESYYSCMCIEIY